MSNKRDEMTQLFYDQWLREVPTLVGYEPMIIWQGIEEAQDPDTAKCWARFTLKHLDSEQTTFGEKGQRKFTRTGIITVQVFTPVATTGGGVTLAENISNVVRDAYEGVGTDSGIRFRNTRVAEIGITSGWYQYNITTNFEYDEVK